MSCLFRRTFMFTPGFTYLSLRESKRRTCQVKELEEKGFLDNGQTFLLLWIPYIFLISRRPLDNWANLVESLRYPKLIDEEFLDRNGNFLTNYFEHGFALLGLDLNIEAVKLLAMSLSSRLNAQLEIR